jgi:hypothetical protein
MEASRRRDRRQSGGALSRNRKTARLNMANRDPPGLGREVCTRADPRENRRSEIGWLPSVTRPRPLPFRAPRSPIPRRSVTASMFHGGLSCR